MNKDKNRFIPCLEPLEQRCCPEKIISIPNPHPPPTSILIVLLDPPLTGGVAAQTGSALNLSVGPIASIGPLGLLSSTLVLEDGAGDVAVSWDGLPFHFFSGVNQVNVLGTAEVNAVVFAALGPLQQPQQVNLVLQGSLNAFFEHLPFPPGAPLNVNAQPPVPTIPF